MFEFISMQLDKHGTIILQATTFVYKHLQATTQYTPSVVLDWDWPNVLISNSKSINATIRVSIVWERGRLQQIIEVIRWGLGPLKLVINWVGIWERQSKWEFRVREFQLLAIIKTIFNGPLSHLMTSMDCWRCPLSKTVLIFIAASILFDLQIKTFGKIPCSGM